MYYENVSALRIQSDDFIVWVSTLLNSLVFLHLYGPTVINNPNMLGNRGKTIHSVLF